MMKDGEIGVSSERRWTSSLDALVDALSGVRVGAVAIDAAGRIAAANAAAAPFLGRAPADLTGAAFAAMFRAPSDRKIARFLDCGPILSGYAFHRGLDATPAAPARARDVSVAILRGVGDVHALALIADRMAGAADGAGERWGRAADDAPSLKDDPSSGGRGGDLASIAAAALMHQMRTPLTTIAGFAELLRSDPMVAGDAERRARIEAIVSAAVQMRSAVSAVSTEDAATALVETARAAPTIGRPANDMPRSNTARFDGASAGLAGAAAQPLAWIEPGPLLRDVAARLGAKATAREVKLNLDLSDAPNRIVTAPTALREAIESLADLAIRMVGAGGRVTLHAVRLDDGGVAIEVLDDGFGAMAATRPAGAPDLGLDFDADAVRARRAELDVARARAKAASASFEFFAAPGAGAAARIVFGPEAVIDAPRRR